MRINFNIVVTVRLTPEIESEIDRIASVEKKTKSDIVKEALKEYINVHANVGSAFKLGEDLFGVSESGDTDRSISYRDRLKEKLRAKHAH
ncbi:MAG: ribbon-helix-helix protein, CopG family [Spirochaetaceae bacterium]|nr:MAG: ribbon-helix-helix protein, CopG family [Spirochaetaceae bacterium]